jgi:hypothetical protein
MHVPDTGPEELQLVMECAELEASTAEYSNWDALELALLSCPYPALVEFNTRHGRTLLTLAERSLEASLAAAAAAASAAAVATGHGVSGMRDDGGAKAHLSGEAAQLATCSTSCLGGARRAKAFAQGGDSYEAKGAPVVCC